MTLEDALKKIVELENENAELRKQLEVYKKYKISGRKKHDAKWQASYAAFTKMYESGMSIMDIVANSEWSRRTCYRYKAYYDAIKKGDK